MHAPRKYLTVFNKNTMFHFPKEYFGTLCPFALFFGVYNSSIDVEQTKYAFCSGYIEYWNLSFFSLSTHGKHQEFYK